MFRHLEVKDGLTNSQVNAIYKDSRGLMWFGTASGLNRFDGYDFKTYTSRPGDSTSLPDNFIETLQEDGHGNLWVRTGMGYAAFDRTTERFNRNMAAVFRHWHIDAVPSYLFIDRHKNFLAYVEGRGVYYIDPARKHVCVFSMQGKRPCLPKGTIVSATDFSGGILLMYNNGQMVCIDGMGQRVLWHDGHATAAGSRGMTYYSAFVDNQGNIITLYPYDTWFFSPRTHLWRSTFDALADKAGVDQIHSNHDMVKCINMDRSGRYWIGMDHCGLFIVDPARRTVTNILKEDTERGLPGNSIQTIYVDDTGLVWIGTYKNGIAIYGESTYKFSVEQLGDVTTISEDRQGCLWLGTNDSGLKCWNRAKGTVSCYDARNGLTADAIVSTLTSADGNVWAGTFRDGLCSVGPSGIRHFRYKTGDANSLANDNVWALAEWPDAGVGNAGRTSGGTACRHILIGTLGGGLQDLDPLTGRFTTYTQERDGLASDYVSSLCVGQGGTIVIGTAEGLSLMNPLTRKITTIKGGSGGTKPFSNLNINQVFEDSRGLIWIATRSGLNVYDPRTDRIVDYGRWTLRDNACQVICGVTEDEARNMWVTTESGVINVVVEMNPRKGTYTFRPYSYDEMDGLQSKQFNLRSILTTHDGQVVMGGLYGINIFDPKDIKYDRTHPKILFTALQMFGKDVPIGQKVGGHVVLPKAMGELDAIGLDYSQNDFAISFATNDYQMPEKMQYVYRLDGFNDQWLTCRNGQHSVAYTNLAPGTYRLRVMAINADGYRSTAASVLTIVIRPPFWLSAWAYILYALLIVAAIWFYRRLTRRREAARFKMEQIKRDAQQKHEMDDMKLRFFTNISHELRTPLTLIIAPLANMIKVETDEKKKKSLQMAHRNALRLLNMVNQLLDFRKNDVQGMSLHLISGDLVNYVGNICLTFSELSDKRSVELNFAPKMERLMMQFDEDKVGKIVNNLLSNAFKFTPEGGSVSVSVSLRKASVADVAALGSEQYVDLGAAYAEISVADTGIGIPDEDKQHIFDRFFQTKAVETGQFGGSGIGLSLVHDFAALHGGTVRVADNPGGGCIFVVGLPLRQTAQGGTAPAVRPAAPLPAATEAPAEATSPMPAAGSGAAPEKPRVLLADDSDDFLAFMTECLSASYRVTTAHDGVEALECMARSLPDIILSDVMMPRMDGNRLCEKVKSDARTRKIPFILLTARLAEEHRIEGLTSGADDYITKPFSLDIVVLRINKLLAWRTSAEAMERGRLIDPTPADIAITSVDERLVRKATQFVEDNISRPDLSVELMSAQLGMSRVHLYKRLLATTGSTPIEFIRIIRLKRAAQLLRESGQNVSEIAYAVGFNEPKYFRKYFRDFYGVLPSAYQEENGR